MKKLLGQIKEAGYKIVLLPQKRLSPSSINTYYKCPRRYFYQYIAKLKIKPSIHMVKGGIVHKALEDFFRGYKKDLKSEMVKRLDNAWKKRQKELRDLEISAGEKEKAYQDCLYLVMEYYYSLERKIKMYLGLGKAENESHAYYLLRPKFREKWVEDKEMKLCGYIDRIHKDFDGHITLGDYKTSNKFGIGLPEEYKRQLALYALLYINTEKIMPDFVSVIFLRFGEEYLLEVTPSLLQYARDCFKYVWERTRSVDIKDYPLYEGKLCKWCPFNEICSGQEDWQKVLRQEKMKKIAEKKEPVGEVNVK